MRGLVAVVLLTACYSPTPPPGAPCASGNCPRGLVCSPATQTCETTAHELDAPLAIDAPGSDTGIDAPASPYTYRRRLTIKNTATTTLPAGYTIRVSLATFLGSAITQGKIKADASDLRLIPDAPLGERDRIVDLPAGPAPPALTFTLAAPLAPSDTTSVYAMYYGRPTASAPPASGSAVFAFYDDFATAISTQWLKNDAPSVSGGKLVLRAGHTDAVTTTAATDGVPAISAVELVASVGNPDSNPTVQPEGTFYYWFGYQHTGDFAASDPWCVWIARGKGAINAEQKSVVGCETGCSGPLVTQNTAPHYYVIERNPGETRFYVDGALSAAISVSNTEDYSLMIRNYLATSDVQVDWFRARARITPEPLVTVGGEEQL